MEWLWNIKMRESYRNTRAKKKFTHEKEKKRGTKHRARRNFDRKEGDILIRNIATLTLIGFI